MAAPEDDRVTALREAATRWLSPVAGRTAARQLARLPDDIDPDFYGEEGVVEELEAEVAELLGHQAALFLPTGTMAQQIALRLHADAAAVRTVAMHPTAHPLLHESDSLTRVQGLDVRAIGNPRLPTTLQDLAEVDEPLAAVLLELPQRELGGLLPTWDELTKMVEHITDRGAAVHLDGARLWECEPAYGHDAAVIGRLFDSVYVSFYKGLEAIGGAALAGPESFVARAAEWRHRMGGRPIWLWPYAASALVGLRDQRPRMAGRLDHLRAVAAAIADLDGVRVTPDPPQAALCHVLLRTTAEAFGDAAHGIAEATGVWVHDKPSPTDHPDWVRIEVHASANLLEFTPSEVADIVTRLAGGS